MSDKNSILTKIEETEKNILSGNNAFNDFYTILCNPKLDSLSKGRIYNDLGYLYFKLGLAEIAKKCWEMALEFNPYLEDIEINSTFMENILSFSDYLFILNNTTNKNFILSINRQKLNCRPIDVISIEINGTCNLNCIMCPRRNTNKERLVNIPYDKIKTILEKVCPYTQQIEIGGLGESLCHPDFKKIVKTIKDYGCKLCFSSNGTFFDNDEMSNFLVENVNVISISIDAATKETYQKIRIGGDFDKVINGIKRLQNKKAERQSSTPKLLSKFTVSRLNYHEVIDFIKLSTDLGLTVTLGHVICTDDEMRQKLAIYNDSKLMEEYLSLLKNDPEHNFSKNIMITRPPFHYISCPFSAYKNLYITTIDGAVHLCCHTAFASTNKYFDDEEPYEIPEISFGNLHEQDFKTIWEKPEYQAYRYGIIKNKPYDFCQKCLVARGMFI